jgi:hypothetical protein
MLHILSMVLQSTMTDKARFNNKREMSVDNGLHGWMEDGNWWVGLMTWRKCRRGHRMTWTSESMWSSGRAYFGRGRCESGSSGGAVMLKQHRIEFIRGNLTLHPW